MSTFATMKSRIADELARSDLTSNISSAVLSAIAHYSKESFYFLESRATASTVSGERNIAYPTGFRYAHDLKVTVSSSNEPLTKITWPEMEALYTATSQTGTPTKWADYQNQIWMYPVPNAVLTLTLSYAKELTALSADADTNGWMVEGEELIRSRAKWDLYMHVIRDREAAGDMKRCEAEALSQLRGLNIMRASGGVQPWL